MMVHQEDHSPRTHLGEKTEAANRPHEEPEAKRTKLAAAAPDSSHSTTVVQINHAITNVDTPTESNREDESSNGGSPSKSSRTFNDTNAECPFTIEIHEFVHLFFDEFGNEIHHLSTTESLQRFTDSRGRLLSNIDMSVAEKHGIVRRDFFHMHHSQIPSYIVRSGASREEIIRYSRDLYRNTVERIHHTGMQTSPFSALHRGQSVHAYHHPGHTMVTNDYHNSALSNTVSDTHHSEFGTGQETNGKSESQLSVVSDLPTDDSERKKSCSSEVNKNNDESNAPNSVPPIQKPNFSFNAPFGGPPVYGFPPDHRSMPFDHYASYGKSQQSLYSYVPNNSQLPFGETNRRMGTSFAPYHEPMSNGYNSNHFSLNYPRPSPEAYKKPGRNMITKSGPDQSSSLGYEAPIHDLNENDVLCGRGGTTNQHVGNRKFRNLVKLHKESYLKCKKKDKPSIATKIVKLIREANPPGRFLKQDKEAGSWFDVGHARAVEKVSQALREGAPSLRKALDIGSTVDYDSDAVASDSGGCKTNPADFDMRVNIQTASVTEDNGSGHYLDKKSAAEEVAI